MMREFSFATDTATMCIFDVECLKHRLADDADWWSVPEGELGEVNAGNVAFLGLGCDGGYSVSVVDSPPAARTISVRLKCPSGRFFVGVGEEVTADGLEPECVRGGQFVTMPAHGKMPSERVKRSPAAFAPAATTPLWRRTPKPFTEAGTGKVKRRTPLASVE
jgi:hypothetical protein